jgi:hypothetical protein
MKLRSMAATAAATTLVIAAAVTPAHASTGNAVRNAVQPSLYKITVSATMTMSSPVAIWPQHTSASNVLCFVPALTSHSIWGGVYWGGQKRCFNTYGTTLSLYAGMS